MSDTNQERRSAVREAWKNERAYVREAKGTRDWSQSEQREIVAKGKADGYEGHHMKSVKDYPQYAGDPQNIQFLNHSEHINGAHKGNTQNATNGYYNPETKTMNGFGNNNPQAPQVNTLSAPLSQRQQDLEIKREQARKQASRQAKNEAKQAVSKTMPNNTQGQNTQANMQKSTASHIQSKQQNAQAPVTTTNQATSNKGIESMRSQAAKAQSSTPSNTAQSSHNKGIETARQKTTAKSSETGTGKSVNQGIMSYQSKANTQSAGNSKSSSSSTVKGSGASSAAKGSGSSSGTKSSGSSSGGQSSGGGQKR